MKTYNNFLNEVLLNPDYNTKSDDMIIISFKKYIYYIEYNADDNYLDKLFSDLGLDVDGIEYDEITQVIMEKLPSAIVFSYKGSDTLDIYRSMNYTFDHNISHHFMETLKTLKKELGVKYIDICENYLVGDQEHDHSETININILLNNFTKDLKVRKLPDVVYHGTCTKNINNILKLGLMPKTGKSNFKRIYHENDYIFLSTDIKDSIFYSTNSAEQTKSFPIVLEIDTTCIDPDNVDFDYDFYVEFIGDGNEYFDELKSTENYKEKQNLLQELKDKYIGATYRKFSYKKRIPTKYIKKIYYLSDGDGDFSDYYNNQDFDDFLEMISYVEEFGYEYLVDKQTLDEFKSYQDEDEY